MNTSQLVVSFFKINIRNSLLVYLKKKKKREINNNW